MYHNYIPYWKLFFHNFGDRGRGGKGVQIQIFKKKLIEIQVILKFGEERMKITLILFVYVISSSKWSFKKSFLPERGLKKIWFKTRENPRDTFSKKNFFSVGEWVYQILGICRFLFDWEVRNRHMDIYIRPNIKNTSPTSHGFR